MTTTIKTVIEQYILLDDEAKVLSKELLTIKNSKKQLSEQISDYLKDNSKDSPACLQIGKNTFKLFNITKRKINKESIESVIKDSIEDNKLVLKIMEEITEESTESYLKRSVKK